MSGPVFARYLFLTVVAALAAIDGGYGWASGRRSPRRIAGDALLCVVALVRLLLLARGVL